MLGNGAVRPSALLNASIHVLRANGRTKKVYLPIHNVKSALLGDGVLTLALSWTSNALPAKLENPAKKKVQPLLRCAKIALREITMVRFIILLVEIENLSFRFFFFSNVFSFFFVFFSLRSKRIHDV